MEGVSVPCTYVLPRGAKPEIVQSTLAALSMTPICCAIISSAADSPLAHQFSEMVVRTESEQDAIQFSMLAFGQTQMPSLVIGTSPAVMAIYGDGRLEEMQWLAHDFRIN